MKILALFAFAALVATPAISESHVSGDAAAGEVAFAKQCVTCHVLVNGAGKTLAGRRSKTGPNLFGVAMVNLGSVLDFRYGASLVQAGEAGHIWTEENFVGYVMDPTGWLRATLNEPKARGKMTFKVRKEEDARNIYAYLVSVAPTETKDSAKAEETFETVEAGVPITYASDQADRGEVRFGKDCEECHGKSLKGGLNGGAPLRGLQFEQKYADLPASALFEFMSTTMPPNAPGRYSATTYAELMAYILKRNGFQAGAPIPTDLDALDNLIIKK